MSRPPRIVMDTNVLVAGLRSRRGASFRLLSLVGTGRFELCLSVPLLLEYESVTSREVHGLAPDDVEAVLDYLCAAAHHQEVFFLWRPYLRDPKDDLVLELAVAAACDRIVSFNGRDFEGVERFGLVVVDPRTFLRSMGEPS